jgi:hypothetical protein
MPDDSRGRRALAARACQRSQGKRRWSRRASARGRKTGPRPQPLTARYLSRLVVPESPPQSSCAARAPFRSPSRSASASSAFRAAAIRSRGASVWQISRISRCRRTTQLGPFHRHRHAGRARRARPFKGPPTASKSTRAHRARRGAAGCRRQGALARSGYAYRVRCPERSRGVAD